MTPPLTNEQLDELLEMEKRATAGPWEMETVKTSIGVCHKIDPLNACIYDDYRNPDEESERLSSAQFITASRNAIRQLVEEVKAHREKTKTLPDRTDPYYFI